MFVKHLNDQYKEALLVVYNKCWCEEQVPQDWKLGLVYPIAKPKKPLSSVDSYRPITLISVLAKVMERMVARRLEWYLEHNIFK